MAKRTATKLPSSKVKFGINSVWRGPSYMGQNATEARNRNAAAARFIKKCYLCERTPAIWRVGKRGYCRLHKEDAYKARKDYVYKILDPATSEREEPFEVAEKKELSYLRHTRTVRKRR